MVRDYLGSLYNYDDYDWAGPVRDPNRALVEMHTPSDYSPIDSAGLAELSGILQEHDVIMQIGGMGSAKLARDANGQIVEGQVHAGFAAYMDAFIADGGASWREAVTARVQEVAEVKPAASTLFWQIGNEVNADSYLTNIRLYFEDDSLETIPVYVEYFLAPTMEAFATAEQNVGHTIDAALGSVSNFSANKNLKFLQDLLDYEIVGDYATTLRGKRVHEVIDLITVHYHMKVGSATNPEAWQDNLGTIRDTWVKDNIRGIWTTEEIGSSAASRGDGAGGSVRIFARYFSWIATHALAPEESHFFFYGTSTGPAGSTIDDAMRNIGNLVGNSAIEYKGKVLLQNNNIEVYQFDVADKSASLVIANALGNEANTLSALELSDIQDSPTIQSVSGWLYKTAETSLITASLDATQISFDSPIELEGVDSVLLWVEY